MSVERKDFCINFLQNNHFVLYCQKDFSSNIVSCFVCTTQPNLLFRLTQGPFSC